MFGEPNTEQWFNLFGEKKPIEMLLRQERHQSKNPVQTQVAGNVFRQKALLPS